MRRQFLIILITICCTTLNATELFYLRASVEHGPDMGVSPPTKSELIKRAHQKVMLSYEGQGALHRVSQWRDTVYCTPVYLGSNNCYEGYVHSTAVFVNKERLKDEWQVRTSGTKKASNQVDGRCLEQHWESARRASEDEARFACSGLIVAQPINPKKQAQQFLDTWYQECIYTATYKCDRR